MPDHCQIPRAIEKILAASHCGVAYMGGSLTVGVGATDVSKTSWRALFSQYLYRDYHPKYHCQVTEIMGGIGACESPAAAFTLERNVMPSNPDLAFVEFCVNDRGIPDKNLIAKGIEGIVRQLVCAKPRCDVILLGSASREGTIDHSVHRRVAEHYDIPFIDLQGTMFAKLKERGQCWDDAAIDFEVNDPWHMNDYGNRLCFEAMKEGFEEQLALFQAGKRQDRQAPIPAPLTSDEFQFTKLIDPSTKHRDVVLTGEWETKSKTLIPWYFDNVLMGKPGSTVTLKFKGTAVAAFGLMYHNGLKLEAVLDGKEIPGFYVRHFIEFGKGLILAHGLPPGEHELKLTVEQPSKRHNKLENPVAQLAFLGIAAKPEPK